MIGFFFVFFVGLTLVFPSTKTPPTITPPTPLLVGSLLVSSPSSIFSPPKVIYPPKASLPPLTFPPPPLLGICNINTYQNKEYRTIVKILNTILLNFGN